MGLVYGNSNTLYKSSTQWRAHISRERRLKAIAPTTSTTTVVRYKQQQQQQQQQQSHLSLTRQNIQFLKNLGLKPSGELPV
uniref:Uncharacterized protein n=1 Tax=Trichogramma kaykai TaxID=54128 RepID=A0ABD2W6F8_9HYME